MENTEQEKLTARQKIGRFFARRWLAMLISFVIGLVVLVIYNVVRGNWILLINYCNGAFIAGFSLLLIAMLTIVSDSGGFYIFSYFFARKKDEQNHVEDFYEYQERRKQNREQHRFTWLPFVIVGGFFLLFSLISLLIVTL